MKKIVDRFTKWFAHSRYAKLLLYIILFFVISSVLMFILEKRENTEFLDFVDGLWWSIITFSTTGYGDKVPITPGGRLLAVVTIFIGVGSMSLLSGSLASWLVERNTKARRGLMDFRKLKDHLVICGWKNNMKDIISDILKVTEDISSDRIVIISNVESAKVETLKEENELKGLRFVRGDYFSETGLYRANVVAARKILILADTLESAAISEVDSKTVMTVLTIKSISRNIYVCAELLDKKYENYLKQAMCDEILYSRDFSRTMLANATAIDGMSHIIYELLSRASSDSHISTTPIPEELISQPYSLLKSEYNEQSDKLLLGLLENTGSPHSMKIEALREAQKTSDVSRLINNLQKVKGMEVNRPVFLPRDDYQIQNHSLAIVLEKTMEE